MNKQEYLDKLKDAENVYKAAKNKIYLEYALSNANFKIGDIIERYGEIILVEKITAGVISFNYPQPVYSGTLLKKDLTPKKSQEKSSIYGDENVKFHKHIVISTIPKDRWGTHQSHCCLKHGCKYGDEDCPVVFELIKQDYPCEFCGDEEIENSME